MTPSVWLISCFATKTKTGGVHVSRGIDLPLFCEVSSVVERYPSKLDVVGSSPITRFL